jgi:hypothetical protein
MDFHRLEIAIGVIVTCKDEDGRLVSRHNRDNKCDGQI